MGSSSSPVEFTGNDLHSYVVVNDGRSYVAISDIPTPLGPSLQPLAALGGVIGWAFALERPGFKNGFSIIGEAKTHSTISDNLKYVLGFSCASLRIKPKVKFHEGCNSLLQALHHTAAVCPAEFPSHYLS